MAKKKELTDKRKRFCLEYMKHCNASKAAKDAGFSEKTAGAQGEQLLKKPLVKEYLELLRDELKKKTDLSHEWVLNNLRVIVNRSLEPEAIFTSKGGFTGEFKFDSSGANKALELIGKHLGTFRERIDLNAQGNFDIKHKLFDEE